MTVEFEANGGTETKARKLKNKFEYYPEWFPINDHFLIYQRHPTPCVWSCLRSTCERNCEMACVWTHAIALLITIVVFLRFLQLPAENFIHVKEEKFVISLTFMCSCLCFAMSAIFHTFYHHSLEVFEFTLRLDLLGIVIGTKGPWFPWIYYSFYCETTFKYFYMTLAVLNALVSGWSLTRGHLLREEKAKQRAGIVVAMFCMSVPGFARVFYRDGVIEAMNIGHGWAVLGLSFGAIGAWLFCSKIPESLYSGKYNSLIGSHAIFHVFSALCVWCCIAMATSLQGHRAELGDVCPS